MFQNNPELTFLGHRTVRSVIGGFLCLILTMLIIISSFFYVGLYLNGTGYTVSHNRVPDNTISDNGGLVLTTGANFKFALTFSSTTSQNFQNITPYMNDTVGIALL
jgi:hypothetical protein